MQQANLLIIIVYKINCRECYLSPISTKYVFWKVNACGHFLKTINIISGRYITLQCKTNGNQTYFWSRCNTLVFLNYGSFIRVNITFLLKAQNWSELSNTSSWLYILMRAFFLYPNITSIVVICYATLAYSLFENNIGTSIGQ